MKKDRLAFRQPLDNASRATRTQALALFFLLGASGCASDGDDPELAPTKAPPTLGPVAPASAGPAPAATPPAAASPATPTPHEPAPGQVELSAPRVVATHAGGLLVIDGSTLEVVSDVPLEVPTGSLLRINPAGDHRHVVVSTGSSFRFLDTGVTFVNHEDHVHYFADPPKLTDITRPSLKPGHVVNNAGITALFSDGSGLVELFDARTLKNGAPTITPYMAAAPHHGVAVPLPTPAGGLLVSVGTEAARTGAVALDATRKVIASADNCPGLHGEAVAQGGAVSLGCKDGALIYRDGSFRKAQSPAAFGQIGTQVGSPRSPVLLADFFVDPSTEFERPTQVALVDSQAATLRLVDLGTSYSWRSLARGADGEALVLGTDGAIHVIDPQLGTVVDKIAVVAPWREPTAWQEPRPVLTVVDGHAFVTEPATSRIYKIDLGQGSVLRSAPLPRVPNELTGASH